jgi:cytochrome P450
MTDLIELFGGNFMSPVADPYPAYARLRHESPVLHVQLLSGPGYLLTRYEDVVSVLRDNTLFSSRANADGIGLVMGRTILEMDGKEHGRHRGIVSPVFVPKALVGNLPGVVESIAHGMIDRFANAGRADLVAQFTKTFPLRVMAHIIGIPVDDFDQFQTWALAIIGFTDDPPAGFAAAQAVVDYVRPIVELRRGEPREDLMSKLVHAEVDGARLEDEEIFSFLRLLIPAGAETTYRLIGNTLFGLLTHPEQLDEVRANRAEIEWAIEEALRWEAPVCLASREPVRPTVIGGVEIPERKPILVAISSANRDESHYPDPARFDIHRRADDHVAFGHGRHFCVGSHLARLEAKTALDALFDRLPSLRLDRSQESGIYGLAFRSPDRLPVVFDR